MVESILNAQANVPLFAEHAVRELQEASRRPDWETMLQAYARCARITRGEAKRYELKPELLVEPAEKALLLALEAAEGSPGRPGSVNDFLAAFEPLVEPITRFFDDVLVMVDDEELKQSRLALLQRIVALAGGTADLSVMEGF